MYMACKKLIYGVYQWQADSPILGLLGVGEGRVAVYGDSNCLDSSHMVTNCYWLLRKILDYTSRNIRDPVLFSDSVKQDTRLHVEDNQLPLRRTDVNFSTYSAVVGKELICRSDSRFEIWGTKGYNLQVRGRNRKLPGYPLIDLGRGLNSTVDSSNLRHHPKLPVKNKGDSGKGYLDLIYGDEVRNNFGGWISSQWLSNFHHEVLFLPLLYKSTFVLQHPLTHFPSFLQADAPVVIASHWLVPAVVAVTG